MRTALACVLLMAVVACGKQEPPESSSGTGPRTDRFAIAGIHIGDSLAEVQALPGATCSADLEAEPDDPTRPMLCELVATFGTESVPVRVGLSNARVDFVANDDLATEGVMAIAAGIRGAAGEPSHVEIVGTERRESWRIGPDEMTVELDAQHGGGGFSFAQAPSSSSSTTGTATATATGDAAASCSGAPIMVKGICLGMPVSAAIERSKAFIPGALVESPLPGNPQVVEYAAEAGSFRLSVQNDAVIGLFIGGPAVEHAFRAGDMTTQAFAQSIVDNYGLASMEVESVTREPFGTAVLETTTYVHRLDDDGIEVRVRGNNAGAKSLELSKVTPTSAHTFD